MKSEHKIMLVEDNSDDIELTKRVFHRHIQEHHLIAKNNGKDAIAYLSQSHPSGKPDLIIVDINLPDLSGLEVIADVRNNPKTKYIPAVVFSSSREPKDILESYSNGANSYIRKPVDSDQFAEVLHYLCQYWLLLNTVPIGSREIECKKK